MEVEVLVKGKKRRVECECPECGTRNVRWVNKQPESATDKLIKKVSFYCWCCEALLTIDPLEEKK